MAVNNTDEERSSVSWEDLQDFAGDVVEAPRATAEMTKGFLDLPDESIPEEEFLVGLLKALGHKTRLQIVELLMAGPTTPSDMAMALEVSPNDASYHLRLLRAAGCVKSARRQQSIVYSLRDEFRPVPAVVREFGATR